MPKLVQNLHFLYFINFITMKFNRFLQWPDYCSSQTSFVLSSNKRIQQDINYKKVRENAACKVTQDLTCFPLKEK